MNVEDLGKLKLKCNILCFIRFVRIVIFFFKYFTFDFYKFDEIFFEFDIRMKVS